MDHVSVRGGEGFRRENAGSYSPPTTPSCPRPLGEWKEKGVKSFWGGIENYIMASCT